MSVYFSSPNVDPVSAKDISRRFYMVEATVPTGHEQGRVREPGAVWRRLSSELGSSSKRCF
jgi:hypothetical protein